MHGSRIICLPLNIPDKIALTVCLRKTRRGRDALPSSSLIPTHPEEQHSPFKRGPPPFFHPDTNPVIGDVLVHSVDKTYVLVVTVELIWLLFLNIISFNFVPTPTKSPSLTRFRRRYINRPAVVLTTVKVTNFLLDVGCSKWPCSFFLQLFIPNDIVFVIEHISCLNVVNTKVVVCR